MEKLQLANIVWLDQRASIARKVGLLIFIASILCWVLFLPYLIKHNFLISSSSYILVLLLGVAIIGGLAAVIVRLLGGNCSEVNDVVADFSARGIRIEGWRSLDKKDIKKIKIEKYKDGCIHVIVRTSIGDEIRLSPSTQSHDASTRRDEYCRLCEFIRTLLTKPSSPGDLF